MQSRARIAGALLLWLALGSVPARGQQPDAPLDGPRRILQDSLLEQLTGDWSMAGRVRGRPVSYTFHAAWVLNHQFLELRMRDVADPPAYQATVYLGYDNTSDRYVCHWLDAFGGRFSETLGYGHQFRDPRLRPPGRGRRPPGIRVSRRTVPHDLHLEPDGPDLGRPHGGSRPRGCLAGVRVVHAAAQIDLHAGHYCPGIGAMSSVSGPSASSYTRWRNQSTR